LAVPVVAVAAPDAGDRAAMVRRAEKIVELLSTRYIRADWHDSFDHDRAAKFLQDVRLYNERAEDVDLEWKITAWAIDHGVSLDRLIDGDPSSMICSLACAPQRAAIVAEDDPFACIAEHRRLAALVDDISSRTSELESELPEERRKAYMIFERGTEIGKDDDSRWTANQTEYWAAVDAIDEIAWSFVDRPPTSAAGLAAMLTYADEHEAAGRELPNRRHYFTAAGTYDQIVEEDWRQRLKAAVISVLQSM
jgi:hypothetical protein